MKRILLVLFLCLSIPDARSQVGIGNLDLIPTNKNFITYFAMNDPEAEANQSYIKVIQEAWTIGKVEFIKFADEDKYKTKESYFLSIGGAITGVESATTNTQTYIYLEFLRFEAPTDLIDKSGKKNIVWGKKSQIARIDLYADFATLDKPQNIFDNDLSFDGHIRNWGPGVLKNYLQALVGFVKRNEEQKLYDKLNNPTELSKLHNSTLLVTEDVLIKYKKSNGDESERFEEAEIFKNYNLKYKLISMKELNEKILNEKDPFYYLLYCKSGPDKFVTIMNSMTGEIAYARYITKSSNFKADDIEDVQKAIMKN